MNVKAENMLMSTLLKKGQFIIPDYQREYDWNKENIDEFFADIDNLDVDERYFIGHIVCEGDFNGVEFKIIDGQQRITTTTIMLCVIRDRFYEIHKANLANGINENYIFSKDKEYNEFVVLENKMPYPVLQDYVQSVPDKKRPTTPLKSGEKKIIAAYNDFMLKTLNWDEHKLVIWRDKILNLEVIFVAVDDEVDAFTIFETLNAKGKDLTPMDLIKNKVFKNYISQPHLDEPRLSWKKIIENSKDSNLKFLNNFWASRFKKVSDRNIYKAFAKEAKDLNYNKFVDDLLKDSIIYDKITKPKEADWLMSFKSFISLEALVVFRVSVANAVLMSLVRELESRNISLAMFEYALSALERFHFINNAICSSRSSGLDTMYSKFAKDLFLANSKENKHKVIGKLTDTLQEKTPDKEKFKASFDDKLWYSTKDKDGKKNNKIVQYALKKIEYKLQNHNVKALNISLEHICPEVITSDWTEFDARLITNIANIVLLDKNFNSALGQKRYELKKSAILAKNTILSTNDVFKKNTEWNNDAIAARREELINMLYNDVWK